MKFIIHLHESENPHYDLMIERGDKLSTWKIQYDDLAKLMDGGCVTGERINDHRIDYLSYEGPISFNRGSVKSYDKGIYELISWTEKIIELYIHGEKIRGKLIIDCLNDNQITIYMINEG